MKQNLIILDTETGGYFPEKNPITEVGLVVLEPAKFKQLDTYQTYVKPYLDLTIEKDAILSTQMNISDLEAGKSFAKVAVELSVLFKKYTLKGGNRATKPILVGHNIPFDIKFLQYLFQHTIKKDLFDFIDESPIDTMRLAQLKEAGKPKSGETTKYNLMVCCERFGIKLKSAHGAMADVNATSALLVALIGVLRQTGNQVNRTEEQKSRSFFQF
jgi:DNA polymerase III epsilon subunit-like protein